MQLPKGTVEPGEAPEDAVRRELPEESGIRFDGPLEPLGMLDCECEAGIEGNVHWHAQLWLLYLMRTVGSWRENLRARRQRQFGGRRPGVRFSLARAQGMDRGLAQPYKQTIARVRTSLAG